MANDRNAKLVKELWPDFVPEEGADGKIKFVQPEKDEWGSGAYDYDESDTTPVKTSGWHHTLLLRYYNIKFDESDIASYKKLIWRNPISWILSPLYFAYWSIWFNFSKEISTLFYHSRFFRNFFETIFLFFTLSKNLSSANAKLRKILSNELVEKYN